MKSSKKQIIVVIVILSLLLIIPVVYSCVFFSYRNTFIRKYTQNMTLRTDGGRWYESQIIRSDEMDTIYCYANIPEFFSDNDAMLEFNQADWIVIEEDGDNTSIPREHFKAHIVFPRFFQEPRVWVRMDYFDDNGDIQMAFFNLDTSMHFLNEEEVSSVDREMYEKLKPRLVEVYRGIYDYWGICKLEEFD